MTATEALFSPPQATVALSDIQLETTGGNVCTSCNCPIAVPNATFVCDPTPEPDGGYAQGTNTQVFPGACGNGHGAQVTITCSPTAATSFDAGNGAPGRGIDVTVTIQLDNTCNDPSSAADPDQGFNVGSVTDVLPGQAQSIGPIAACNGFGSTCGFNTCNFNSVTATATVENTGGYFKQAPQ
jgi:hypothetical protein